MCYVSICFFGSTAPFSLNRKVYINGMPVVSFCRKYYKNKIVLF